MITSYPGHTIHHVPADALGGFTLDTLVAEPPGTHLLDDQGNCWCLPMVRLQAAWCGPEPVYEVHAYHQES